MPDLAPRTPSLSCAIVLAAATWAGACGSVNKTPPVDGPPIDQTVDSSPQATMYKGQLSATNPVNYGPPKYCPYTITLQSLNVELVIEPSGVVSAGRVQDRNVEASVDLTCTKNVIAPNNAIYTLKSAQPGASTTTLTFQGDSANNPGASLVVDLSSANSIYTAKLTFQRIDQPADPDISWKVVIMSLTLLPQ